MLLGAMLNVPKDNLDIAQGTFCNWVFMQPKQVEAETQLKLMDNNSKNHISWLNMCYYESSDAKLLTAWRTQRQLMRQHLS